MRPPILLLAALILPADLTFAQVTIDLHALDALPGKPTPAPRTSIPVTPPRALNRQAPNRQALNREAPDRGAPSQQASAARPAPTPAVPARSADAPAAASVASAQMTPTQMTPTQVAPIQVAPIPAGPLPDATLPDATPPPPPTLEANAAPPPAPTAALTAPAVTAAAVRLGFAPNQSTLGGEDTELLKQLVEGAPRGDNTTFNVVAFASATPDDPSAARRLSLSRALAVRSALMAAGIASGRIYVRALGGQGGDGPPDRADVSVLGTTAPNAGTGRPQ